MEYVSPEGFRLDGHRPLEMRQIRAKIGVLAKADGSAVFEVGNTKVLAAVYGSREVQNRSQQISDQALVRCEYSMANFSTGDCKRKPKGDKRSTEISLVIHQTMEACIMTHLMSCSQIFLYKFSKQMEGLDLPASLLQLWPMCDLVTSSSAGYLNGTPLLVTVGILPKLNKATLLQMDSKLLMDIFESVVELATKGCKAIANYLGEVLQENTQQLEYRRGL